MKVQSNMGRILRSTWVTVGICFLTVFVSLGFCSSGRSLYLTAITGALDLPRGAFALNDTVRYITTAVVNLFFGVLIQRFGTKRLICAGFLCMIGFALVNSVATGLLGFYFAGVLLGIGLSWTGTTMVSAVISRCNTSHRSTLTGAALAANGIGGALSVQLLTPIIFREGDPFGYRDSYRLVALILGGVLLLVLLFYRDPKPTEGEGAPSAKKKPRGAGWGGMEYREVIKRPYFYVALLAMMLIGMVLQGLNGIATPHMLDVGLGVGFVSLLTSASGLLLTASKFLTGYLYDHCGIRRTLAVALPSAVVSVLLLVLIDQSRTGEILGVIHAPLFALAMPLETVMLPIFASEFFGNRAFDQLIGIFVSVSTVGFAIGAPLGNLFYDLLGDYRLAFLLLGVLMLVASGMLVYVLRCAGRDRAAILAAEAARDGVEEH